MKPRILAVEDDTALRNLLAYNLNREGFDTLTASNGSDAMAMIEEEQPDLMILDWMLPEASGLEVCRWVRRNRETRRLPIIMLTARGIEADRIRGLDTGADDYVSKPFSMAELILRVRAVLRRTDGIDADEDSLRVADIAVNRSRMRVTRGARVVSLGPTEFRLLYFLMRRPGRVYSRGELLDRVWGRDIFVEERTVDVHVGRLRKALNRGTVQDPIRTVRSAGYAFDETYGSENDISES
ncbi:MAG: phosphate regulon transcriptional regulator PhoB [Paracoccaceae bacterium]|nr:phosphate regulon transcriptional regulator PhoB [Paracoccaceae bacterium]